MIVLIKIFVWTVAVASVIAALVPPQSNAKKQKILGVLHKLSLNVKHAQPRCDNHNKDG